MQDRKVVCKIMYRIKDSFRDPLDIDSHGNPWLKRKIGLEVPLWGVNLLGSPYGLVANWEVEVDGCSEPEDCSHGIRDRGNKRSRR